MIKSAFIAIVGPTGTGKTDLSLYLSKKFKAPLISMDSMQIYKGMDIGTAKVEKTILQEFPHEMIDIIEPIESFSLNDYSSTVKKLIDNFNKNNKIPILVGGTGMYLKSIMYDYTYGGDGRDNSLRNKLIKVYNSPNGKKMLYSYLKKIDPIACNKIFENDCKRVVRAIEIYRKTGKRFSDQKLDKSKYNSLIFGLNGERSEVYNNINDRVDKMIKSGLVQEVKDLLSKNIPKECQSMQAIGYKELIEYFEKKLSLDEAIDNIKLNTRHYAKRQLTMFKSIESIHWYNFKNIKSHYEEISNKVENFMGEMDE